MPVLRDALDVHWKLGRARRSDRTTLTLVNAAEPTRTHGAEAFVRWSMEPWTVTASHTFVVSTEDDPGSAGRRDILLTPRHASGIVAMWEGEDRGRVGAEFYYRAGLRGDRDRPMVNFTFAAAPRRAGGRAARRRAAS